MQFLQSLDYGLSSINYPHRFESKNYNYSSTFQALRAIVRKEGFRGLTVGLGPTLVRDVPFSGLYLMFYEHLKTMAPDEMKVSHGSSVHFSCGVMAGFLASLVTQPADVIKTRLQLSRENNKSIPGVIRQVYQQQGLAGFTSCVLGCTAQSCCRLQFSFLIFRTCPTLLEKDSDGSPGLDCLREDDQNYGPQMMFVNSGQH